MAWPGGKTIIITGSTRGIGLETARELVMQGANVTVFCRHKRHGLEAFKRLPDRARLHLTQGDVRAAGDMERVVRETVDQFGGVDALINNAGVAVYDPVEGISEETYDAVMETNAKGAFLATRAALPYLRKREDARLVFISSGLGLRGGANYTAYAASKFAMIGMSECLAEELDGDGVSVSAVAPGGVNTKLHRDIHPDEDPMGMMQPEYVAKKIVANIFQGKPYKQGGVLKIFS